MSFESARAERLRWAGNSCEACGSTGDLHAHHRMYERFREEHPEDLLILCATCHGAITASLRKRSDWTGRPRPSEPEGWFITERGKRLIEAAAARGWRATEFWLTGPHHEMFLDGEGWTVWVMPKILGDVRITDPLGHPAAKCPLDAP